MIRILLTLIFGFQSISCEKQHENKAFPSLAFRENQELISSVKRFNNLSMSIPKNMEKLDSVSFKQLEFNFFVFHLSSKIMQSIRNFFMKFLIKRKRFTSSYLGTVYKN